MGITVCRRQNSSTVHPSSPSGSSSSISSASSPTMFCGHCAAKFTISNKKHICNECRHIYCSSCLIKIAKPNKGYICRKCQYFSSIPFEKNALMNLRIRDLKWFLDSRSVSFEGCTEKTELVDLVMQCGSRNLSESPQTFLSPPQSSNNLHPMQPAPEQAQLHRHHTRPLHPSSIFTERQDTPNEELERQSRECVNNNGQHDHRSRSNEDAIMNERNVNIPTNRHRGSSSNITTVVVEDNDLQEETLNEEVVINEEGTEGWGGGAAVVNIEDIKDPKKIEELSVRQMKLILTRNYIDYRGCCEKKDLQERVRRLWLQRQTLGDTIVDENLCKLCMASAIDCVLLECGHMATCTTCGKRLPECPICRQYVTRVVHIFKA